MRSQLRFSGWGNFCLEGLFFHPSDRRGEHVGGWLSLLNRGLLPDGVSQTEHKAALLHFTSGLTP